jgi:hypothetical protein
MKINELADLRSKKKVPDNIHDIIALLELNCPDSLAALKEGKRCFKGIGGLDKPFYKSNPKLKIRKSRNTKNYYTLLFDNLPSWSAYPKRSQSLICTTSTEGAYIYGTPFLVLPFNGAKFGVCPDKDIWYCFKNIEINSLNIFTKAISDCGIADKNFNNLIYELRMCGEYNASYKFDKMGMHIIADAMKNNKTNQELIDKLNFLFDPKRNGFELANIKSIPDYGCEIWTDSESYLINTKSNFFNVIMNRYS